jgi:hypothetical protein
MKYVWYIVLFNMLMVGIGGAIQSVPIEPHRDLC